MEPRYRVFEIRELNDETIKEIVPDKYHVHSIIPMMNMGNVSHFKIVLEHEDVTRTDVYIEARATALDFNAADFSTDDDDEPESGSVN